MLIIISALIIVVLALISSDSIMKMFSKLIPDKKREDKPAKMARPVRNDEELSDGTEIN